MGKVIAFDRNRSRLKTQSAAFAQRTASQAKMGSGSRIHAFPQKKEEILVSVVIPACGRPHLLSQCLASLISQQLNVGRYEIIVVDAKSNPGTRDIVNDWAHHAARHGPSVSYIAFHGNGGTAAARNRGWRAARGAIVAFIDEDVVVRSDWLEKGLDAFDTEVRAVWGRIMAPVSASPVSNTVALPPEQQAAFQSSNYFVRKDTLREIGGFDERFTASWGEEADLYFRLAEQPARVIHHPRLIASHAAPPANCSALLAQQRRHLWDALLYKKHPQLYRQKIRTLPYGDFYLITAMLMLAAFSLMAGAVVLGASASIAWLALTLRLKRRQQRCNDNRPSEFSTFMAAALGPPVGIFWHLAGMLRFRTAYF